MAYAEGNSLSLEQSKIKRSSNGSSKKSTSSKSSGGTATVGNTSTFDAQAYLDLLNGLKGKQSSGVISYYDAGNSAAQDAYNRNMEALNVAYDKKVSALKDNYNSTVESLNRQNDASKAEVNTDADRALREAYINKMLSARNLTQQMTAQGLSGGATETTLASMQNNYGNSRNGIETTRADNLTKLYNTLQDNLAAALQAYNTQRANADDMKFQYQMQIENALSNALAENYMAQMSAMSGIDESYNSLLQQLIANQGAYTYDNAQANNVVKSVSTAMNNSNAAANAANYARMKANQQAYLEQLKAQAAAKAAQTVTVNPSSIGS